jgi:uncharacterized protein
VDVTAPRQRLIEVDVVRGLALIGVCVMNYHGYLIGDGAKYPPTNFVERVFDPREGPLSTRFAATFVTLAGMGIALLTRRSVTAGGAAVSAERWKLIRRGVLLFSFGYFLDWVWPGTILFFYGALFAAGAALFTVRTRWLMALGSGAALAAALLKWWQVDELGTGHDLSWLFRGRSEQTLSPRDLVFDTFVRGTHPLLPWLVFLCLGIALGRMLPFTAKLRTQLAAAGAACLAIGYLAKEALAWHPTLESTRPFDRGVLYTLTTVGSSLLAVTAIGWLAERTRGHALTRAIADAGRTTLTLYIGHVLVYNLLVHWLGWVEPGALGTALLFAGVYWVVAVLVAVWLHRRYDNGPLEWVYRKFSDPVAVS